jgi:hypothetical protein
MPSDHVELLGAPHELHGAIVGEHVLQFDVGVVGRVDARDDLVPEHAGLHHVALLGRRHLVAARARQIEGDACDAVDLGRGVDLRVDGALLAGFERHDFLRLAEIDAARQLAHDQDIEALDQFALE